MAITVNNAQSAQDNTSDSSDTLTSYAVSAGSDQVLIAASLLHYFGTAPTTSSATFGASAMTLAKAQAHSVGSPGEHCHASIWYLDAPGTTTATITCNYTGIPEQSSIHANYLNGAASGGPEATNGGTATSSPASLATTTLSAGAVVFTGLAHFENDTLTFTGDGTEQSREDISGGNHMGALASHIKATAGSVSHSWAYSDHSFDHVNALASAAWAAASGDSTITVSGISSAEAFGTATLAPGVVTVLPVAIDTAEAFGGPTVSPGGVTLAPAGIASAEAFGSLSLTINVLPSGIVTAEAFGDASLLIGIVATGIASQEAFGTPLLIQAIAPEAIASAEALGLTVVVPGAVTILPPGIATEEAFGGTTIGVGAQTILSGAIASDEIFGSVTVEPGAVVILPSGIVSAEAFGSPQIGEPGVAGGKFVGLTRDVGRLIN